MELTEVRYKKKKKKIQFSFGSVFKYVVLSLGVIVALLPILVVLIGSFKSNEEFLSSGVLALLQKLDFINYITAFVYGHMLT